MSTVDLVVYIIAALIVLGFAAWYVLAAPGSQVLCRSVSRAQDAGNTVALTFDDGPGPETEQILQVLRQHDAQATFFLCGANVERYPELVRRIAADGHAIGNHAYSHKRFLGKSARWMKQEIERAQQAINAQVGRRATRQMADDRLIFRPPYGLRWVGLSPVMDALNCTAVMWSVTSEDWTRSPEEIAARVVRLVHPGCIILLHDGVPPNEASRRNNTVRALPEILRRLSPNYRFVTVPELLRLEHTAKSQHIGGKLTS